MFAAEPFVIKQGACDYRILIVPNVENEWEPTADLKFAVFLSEGNFQVVSVADEKVMEKRIPAPSTEWKVVGSELIIGTDKGWEVYSIPGLEKRKSIPAPPIWPSIPGTIDRSGDVPRALSRGWYCRGLVYDDGVEKVWASFRAPIESNSLRRTQEELDSRNLERFLRTQPHAVFPFDVQSHANKLIFPEFDRISIDSLEGISLAKRRFGLHWLTGIGVRTANGTFTNVGLFVEFLSQDYLEYEFGNRPRFPSGLELGLKMPGVVLDERINASDWVYEFWPSGKKARLPFNVSPDSMEESRDESSVSRHLLVQKLREGDLAGYLEVVRPEFERIAGRLPRAIPVPILFEVSAQDRLPFSHVVWVEVPQEELEKRFVKGRVAKRGQEETPLVDDRQKLESKPTTNGVTASWYTLIVVSLMIAGSVCTAVVVVTRSWGDKKDS